MSVTHRLTFLQGRSHYYWVAASLIGRWEAAPFTYVVFQVPDNWVSGRIWVRMSMFFLDNPRADSIMQGRRGCDFTIKSGPTCLTGSCNGGLLCDQHTGTVRLSVFTVALPR